MTVCMKSCDTNHHEVPFLVASYQLSSGFNFSCCNDHQTRLLSAIPVSVDLLLSGVLPEHHQGEVPFAAEADACGAVIALVGLALLLGWEVKAALGHHHRGIALALAKAARHRFRQAVALIVGLKQAAPRFGAVSFGGTGGGEAAQQAEQAQ